MAKRNLYMLIGIVVLSLLAIIVDLSGVAKYTLRLWQPVTISEGLDLQGGARFLLDAVPQPGMKAPDSASMEAARQIIESRVSGGLGVTGPVVQVVQSGTSGHYSLSVELPGLKKNLQDVEKVLQRTGQLTIVALNSTNLQPGQSARGYKLLAHGTDIDAQNVSAGYDPNPPSLPAVFLTIRGAGQTNVTNYSISHVNQYMGIAIDGIIYETSTIQQPLTTGDIMINGIPSIGEAQSLAATLKYGALPVPLKIVSTQEISPSLGPSNIRASIVAGSVGLFIVMLFMATYYRLPGLLADLALIIYALVVFATFKLIPNYTLTLAGFAGFILSIGMAVDANILIFERMKEELRAGHSVPGAVEAGFARAWPSIRDSNVSTMITCSILWFFGAKFATSTIVGFAISLLIGVIISMATAILISRTFLRFVLAGRVTRKSTLFGADTA